LLVADQVFSVKQGARAVIPATEPLVCLNAAAMKPAATVAADSLVAAFGKRLAVETKAAGGVTQELGFTRVSVTDQNQTTREAQLLFVSPTQVNFVFPTGLATGPATVTVTSGDGYITSCTLNVAPLSPGLFTLNGNGKGLAAGQVLRIVESVGSQSYEPLARYDSQRQDFVALPVKLNTAGEKVALVLYGTGLRGQVDLNSVTARIGDVNLRVSYCGLVYGYFGLDQVNIPLPASLAGRGMLTLELSVAGKTVNTVDFAVK
jgi:uncharacterized protein (TIGR03437 family)